MGLGQRIPWGYGSANANALGQSFIPSWWMPPPTVDPDVLRQAQEDAARERFQERMEGGLALATLGLLGLLLLT